MKKTVILGVIALIGLSSCIKEPVVENKPQTPAGPVLESFTASAEDTSTKTELSGNDEEGYKVLWKVGDDVFVTDAAGNSGTYMATENASSSTFYRRSSSGGVSVAPYKAYYPATLYQEDGSLLWPSTQEYRNGNINESPMYAEGTELVHNSNNNLAFKNLGGIIRLDLKTSGTPFYVGKIEISADEGLSGVFTISGNATDGFYASVSGTEGVTLVGAYGNSLCELGADTVPFHFAVPAGTYNNLKITVFRNNFSSQTRTANKPIVVERSKITSIALSFNNLEENPTNLSLPEPANCYIVRKAGAYKFKANVAGNGLAPQSGISNTIASIASADLLWATNGTTKAPSGNELIRQVSYRDGYVYFTTGMTFMEGNALVAVKDASGNILWSWHIWFESDDLEAVAQKYNSYTTVMDRNLGATTNGYNADNFFDAGLYYEWGRKDPFPGVVERSSSSARVARRGSATTSTLSSMNIAGSIAKPTANSTSGADGATWYTTSKNIFDPCPAGWRVPSPEVFSLIANQGTPQTGGWSIRKTVSGQVYDIWFPAAGVSGHGHEDFFTNVGSASYTYTNTSAYARSFDFTSSDRGNMREKDSYWACNVRCVKDTDVPDPDTYIDLSEAIDYVTEGGTANCYIVKPNIAPDKLNFKFPATVRGNGSTDLAGVSSTIPEGQIASAELLWESFSTTTAPATDEMITQVLYRDGYVLFTVERTFASTNKVGNAVIAVKDGAGQILWSWHLWMGRNLQAGMRDYWKLTTPGGTVFMKLNLGALDSMSDAYSNSTSLDYGLLYQWGRKDPFLNAPTRENYTATEAAVLGQTIVAKNQLYSVEEALQNPTHFPFTYNDTPWMVESQMNIALWDSDKTIFDPCPPGWKVPAKASWGDEFINQLARSSYYSGRGYSYFELPDAGFRQGVRTSYISGSSSSVMIQGTGIIQHPGSSSNGFYRYWCSDGVFWMDSFGGSSRMGLYDYDVNLLPDSGYFYYGTWRDNACSVRCVQE